MKGVAVAERIGIIVTTYERDDALDAVLRSLARQTDRGFEVVIGDDGSGAATTALIAAWRPRLGVSLMHVWQEHDGFRAGEIRNRAILASSGDYFIFLDGDCIVRPDFVAAHRRLARRGFFVSGNRVLLSRALTEVILRERMEPETWGLGVLLAQRLRGGINRLLPAIRLPLGPLRTLRGRVWQGARSCNLAVWRDDLYRIDGFDADFSGWGLEDSDLIVRLLHAGVRRKDGVFGTGVYHLWHPESDRSRLPDNRRKLEAVIKSDRTRAGRGLSSLEPEVRSGGQSVPARSRA